MFFVVVFFFYLLVPPKVNISGASNLIKEGNSVKLTCEIVAGRPEPEITWLKNNTLLQKSWSLLLPKIKKKDEGLYTCKAENAAGILTEYVEISVKGEFVYLIVMHLVCLLGENFCPVGWTLD